MICQCGVQYYKPKTGLGKRNHLQGKRKIGCKAHIILREYILSTHTIMLLTHTIANAKKGLPKKSSWKNCTDFEIAEKVQPESRYYVSLLTEEAHHGLTSDEGDELLDLLRSCPGFLPVGKTEIFLS